jgi:uncharacterized membrane protein YGL010W
MRAILTLEASRSDGTKYRMELSLGVFVVGWLLRYFGL